MAGVRLTRNTITRVLHRASLQEYRYFIIPFYHLKSYLGFSNEYIDKPIFSAWIYYG